MEEWEWRIRLWFSMWLQKTDLGILDLFDPDAVYVESWGPEYHGVEKIRHWFREWNTRGTVQVWDVGQFFHKEEQTLVTWYFQNAMDSGAVEAFDGVTLVRWTPEGKIGYLQEFGCNIRRYDPYAQGPVPRFRDEASIWF